MSSYVKFASRRSKNKVGKPRERNPEAKAIKQYLYTDYSGRPWIRKTRYEPGQYLTKDGTPEKKSFLVEWYHEIRLRRPKTGYTGKSVWSWSYGLPKGVPGYVYRLPELRSAIDRRELVFIVDGEKDADTLWSTGIASTCVHGGNGQIAPYAKEQLAGAEVIIVVDRDDNNFGAYEALKWARLLRGQVVAFFESASGKDTTDHFSAGLGLGDMCVIQLDEIVRRREQYESWLREERAKSS